MLLRVLFYTVIVYKLVSSSAIAQTSPFDIYQQVVGIENSDAPPAEKLKKEAALKIFFERHYKTNDSVYAFILHRVALLHTKTTRQYQQAIALTLQAAQINLSGAGNCSRYFAVNNLFNIGSYFESLENFKAALQYYDSAIQLQEHYPAQVKFFYLAHINRSVIYYNLGNYQEALDDARLGLSKGDDSANSKWIGKLYYHAAQAMIALSLYRQVQPYISKTLVIAKTTSDSLLLGKCLVLEANLAANEGKPTEAIHFIDQAVAIVKNEEYPDQKAIMLLEAGSLYFDLVTNLPKSEFYYQQVLNLRSHCKDTYIATACNNLGHIAFKKGNVEQALQYYQTAVELRLKDYSNNNIFNVPLMQQIRLLPEKNDLFINLGNKAELLMLHFKKNRDLRYLQAAYKNYMVADSVITNMRYGQTGETSKLYWRKLTHTFHQHALEVCSLLHDPDAAFYFMEKSRAALLNDRLNELGATNQLPAGIAAQEQALRMEVVEKQIMLSDDVGNKTGYSQNQVQQHLLTAQQNLERYIKELEQKYPAYYQYKYADEVPVLNNLQQYLQKTNRRFVQYFVGDTVLYLITANGSQSSLICHSIKSLEDSITLFLNACANKDYQNRFYPAFVQSSYRLYKTLLPSLSLSFGSLIISPDNVLIPFDALCTDTLTKRMMVQDFAISYTYSARFLLKPFIARNKSTGDFFGMAPVRFPVAMQLSPLQSSKAALASLKEYYPGATLLSEKNATRHALLENISAYTIVNLYTHARADSNSAEPELFLSDSAIRLSELQMIQKPATQLVVLSACQTNTGKLASGEGVYTIARGFAMAGIPAAVATLWKADEQATYFITGEFHKNISQGMAKDIALQQAKLSWLKQADREHSLPFYWANLTLMGNADAIVKPAPAYWWFIAAALVLSLVIAFAWQRYKQKSAA